MLDGIMQDCLVHVANNVYHYYARKLVQFIIIIVIFVITIIGLITSIKVATPKKKNALKFGKGSAILQMTTSQSDPSTKTVLVDDRRKNDETFYDMR